MVIYSVVAVLPCTSGVSPEKPRWQSWYFPKGERFNIISGHICHVQLYATSHTIQYADEEPLTAAHKLRCTSTRNPRTCGYKVTKNHTTKLSFEHFNWRQTSHDPLWAQGRANSYGSLGSLYSREHHVIDNKIYVVVGSNANLVVHFGLLWRLNAVQFSFISQFQVRM